MFYKILIFTLFNSLILTQNLFFSEYAEGSSNNKYLEIYNPTSSVIDLSQYAYPSTANAPTTPGEYEYWNEFDAGASINPGDVYVICHGSADPFIAAECDENHTYLSNGNDGYCLVFGTDANYTFIDCIGDWNADPGDGWDVAGVSDGTKDHTLVRKTDVIVGNSGNWSYSAGTNADNSEWIVLEQNEWTYLGSHPHDIDGGTTGGDDGGSVTEDCSNGVDDDGDGYVDCDDFDCTDSCEGSEDCTNGIDDDGDGYVDCNDFDCTGSSNCSSEICDDGVDNDDDTYVDCDDFDCGDDPACDTGSEGSCAEYGCVGYNPANACQCNDLCVDYNNCCDDYEEVCGGDDGGASDPEICDDGIDNDGDGYVDCDDFNCDGTFGDIDPACSGTSDGGNTGGGLDDADNLFFSEYAEGSSNNKYLEIYNAESYTVDLSNYSISTCANGCNDGSSWDYPDNVSFSSGTFINSGDVYVVCNGSADASILAECDQTFTYLSNGDDVMGLTQLSTGGILDIIGEIGDDPGNGWDVAGVNDATKDHTLVRKLDVVSGNQGNWSMSAGTSQDDSEWIVYDQNYWDELGSHGCPENSEGCTDSDAFNFNPCAVFDDGTCQYYTNISINDIQGGVDVSPYADMPIITSGIVTAVASNGFYLQNANGGLWSGIWVYGNNVDGIDALLVGDEVEVTGVVLEFYNLTEIEAQSFEVVSSNNTLPESIEISTGDLSEAYEGVLVQVNNSECISSTDEFGDWVLNDGSGNLKVGDKLISSDCIVGQYYDVEGVGDFSFDEFKVQAITADIAYQEGMPTAVAGENQEVELGETVTLNGNLSFDDGDGSIIGYEWAQTSGISVNLGDYENPTITFQAPNSTTTLEFSLVVIDNEFNFSAPDYVTVQVGQLGIYDIQYSSNLGSGEECYPSSFLGQNVENIKGVVTVVKSFSSYPNFFIQDPDLNSWGGIYVYVGESDALSIGDEVMINGEVDEYYGVTELTNISNIQVLSTNNDVTPISISTGDLGLTCGTGEAYEGMFVEFTNAVVESIDTQYNSIYINDGSGTAKIDDYFFSFDAGSWPDLSVGDSIELARGAVHYYFGEYVIYPRDLNDLVTTGGGGGDPVSTSIYDIQYSSNLGSGEDCYPSSLTSQNVNVSGIVTSVKSFSSSPHFFIQDPALDSWSGVYVYVGESDPLSIGDEVIFDAQVDEYYGVTELKDVSNIQVLSTNNDITPVSIGTGDLGLTCGMGEAYEGMFVEFTNITVESINEFGDVYVNDGSGTAKTGDYFFNYDLGEWPQISSGDTIDSIKGVIHYYYGEYILYPRDLNDILFGDGSCTADGDVNSDGVSNVIDVVQLVNYVLGMTSFNEAQMCSSDLNSDGIVNVIDIVQLVNLILG